MKAATPRAQARSGRQVGLRMRGRTNARHERQANDAAASFVRGGCDLSALITPAPASAFVAPGSAGLALPYAVRHPLEAAFGAELDAVRIHLDTVAANAAATQGARAFASGTHIYFGAAQFSPDTLAGRGLLAHEVAHVLQQTGRVTHGGRWRAVPVRGDADVQRVSIPDFATLRPAHAPGKSSADRAKFDLIADEISLLVKSTTPDASVDKYALGKLPAIRPDKWPHSAEGLLYDTLKHYGKWETAAMMLERDNFLGGNRINTVASSPDLNEALEKRNGGWAVYVKAFTNIAWLKAYETEWLRQWDIGLFLPGGTTVPRLTHAKTPGGAVTETINEHVRRLYEELADPKTVSNNEWVYRALLLMSDLDDLRANKIVELSGLSTENDATRAKSARAQGLVNLGKHFVDAFSELPSVATLADAAEIKKSLTPYLTGLGKKLVEKGQAAANVWALAQTLEAIVHASSDKALADKAGPAEVALAKELEGRRPVVVRLAKQARVSQTLAEYLRELNQPDKQRNRQLDSVQWRERGRPIVERLDAYLREKLEMPQGEAFIAGRLDELLSWIALAGWFRTQVGYLRWTLNESPPKGQRPPVGTPDEVNYHRIRIARRIRVMADELDWIDSTEAADAILEARLEKRSVLALVPFDDGAYWKEVNDERDLITRAARESTGVIRNMEPLSLPMIMQFFTAVFYEEMAFEIRRGLPRDAAAEKNIVDANTATPYLAAQAYKAVIMDRPRRWSAKSSEFARKAGDKRDYMEILQAHPAYTDFRKANPLPVGWTNVFPLEPMAAPYVWDLPDFGRLMERLKRSALLNSFVAATFTGEPVAAKRVQMALDLNAYAWFAKLQKVLAEKLKDEDWKRKEWASVVREASTVATGLLDEKRAVLVRDFKKAMRRDRQLIANQMKSLLGRFAANHYDFAAMLEVNKLMRQFFAVNVTLDDADRDRQVAALFLEMTSALDSALGNEDRFDIVYPMVGPMEQALEASRTIKGLPTVERDLLLPPHENQDAWIDAKIAALDALTKKLQAVRESVQKTQGFRADHDKQTIESFVKLSSPMPIGEITLRARYGSLLTAEVSADAYRILSIERSFVFHPAYGDNYTGGPRKADRTLKSGYRAEQLREPDDKTPLNVKPGDVLLKVQLAVPRKGGWMLKGPVINVTAAPKDMTLLNELYNGITWAGFGSAMGNIQAGIQQILEFYVDAAELLPGVGPAIAAARITVAIAEFLASNDFDAICDMVSGGLSDIITGLENAIRNSVDPTNLMVFLLFGDPRLDYLLAHSTFGTKKPEPKDQTGEVGKLRKVINAFKRLGRAFFKLLRKLETKVERPMQDVRAYASTRPLLAFVLNFIADHIFEILALAKAIQNIVAEAQEKGDEKNPVAAITRDLKLQQDGFGKRIAEILHHLEGMKLPEKVVNIAPAIAMVLTFAESMIIKKAGFAGKVVSLALKHSGAYDYINERIAEKIVDLGVDPNIYWRDTIRPQLEGRFNEMREGVVNRVNEILTNPNFKDVFDPVPAVPAMKIETDPGEKFAETEEGYTPPVEEAQAEEELENANKATAPDTQPAPSPDRRLRVSIPFTPGVGAGRPLSTDLRAFYERSLGQDLRHVRLHTGSDGGAMTRAFGADALTSGSHVYMREGRSPEGNPDLLAHELVHVLQQSGPRGLGEDHDATPVPGHPERGLDWDPAREAEAHDVAAALGRRSFAATAGAPHGMQPAGVDWFAVARMMREFSNLSEVKARAAAIEKEAMVGTHAPPKEVADIVDKVLATLRDNMLNENVVKPLGPFTSVMTLVQSRIKDKTYADPIAKGAREIAFEALDPPTAVQGQNQHLSPRHFARQLEGFILYKTGLGFTFDLNTSEAVEGGKKIARVDPGNPVKKIQLVHIHLPQIDGRADLWAKVMVNTWPTKDAAWRIKMRKVLRPLLESKGLAVGIWPIFGKEYRFSTLFTAEAQKEFDARAAAVPSVIPPWTDYVKTRTAPSGDYTGLRLSTYGNDDQTGVGRQSHHLTQFLLADYFSNTNESKPFQKGFDYPGVTFTTDPKQGTVVKTIANRDQGGDVIDVAKTKGTGRGDDMPALSLAAVTHQKGKLHVSPEADEQQADHTKPATPKKTQGSALKNEFTRRIGAELASDNLATFKSYFRTHSRDDAAKTIYNAAQDTYASIEKHMSTQLTKNMAQLEFDYYMGIAEDTDKDIRDKTNPDAVTAAQKLFMDQLKAVPLEAKAHNEKVMRESFGWKL